MNEEAEASEAELEAYERSMFEGKMNPSLFDLKHLIHLDLSDNNYEGIQIPEFLGLMRTLRNLNLSTSGFIGRIPHQKSLRFAISFGLSLLKHLDLSYVDLSKVFDWLLVR